MPTDLAFGTGAGDYRQLRFGGAASLIPLQGFSAVASGTAAVANTAQAVFAVGFTASETGEPFAGAPAHLTFAGAPTAATQLRFGSSESLVPLQGIPPSGVGKGSITNAAWAVWMVGNDMALLGAPLRGPSVDLLLDKPIPATTALVFGAPGTLLPLPGSTYAELGLPTIRNGSIGVFVAGLHAEVIGEPFVGTPTNLMLAEARSVGQPLDLYFNYGDALRPQGLSSLAIGAFDATNTGRALYPSGFDSLAVGLWRDGTKTVTLPSVGNTAASGVPAVDTRWKIVTPTSGVFTGYGTARVYSNTIIFDGFSTTAFGATQIKLQTVFGRGEDMARYAMPLMYNLLQPVLVYGLDTAVLPAPSIQLKDRRLSLFGFAAASYGEATIYNWRQLAYPHGLLFTAIDNATISDINRTRVMSGADMSVFGASVAKHLAVGPHGVDASAFAPPWVSRAVRTQVLTGETLSRYGNFSSVNLNRYVRAPGISAPAWVGNMLVRDRTSRIYGKSYDAAGLGVFSTVSPQWVFHKGEHLEGGVGRPSGGYDYSGQVHAYGLQPTGRAGVAHIYNNARIVRPLSQDMAVVPKVLDVAGPVKAVYVGVLDTSVRGYYTIVYNAALARAMTGEDMARYGTGLQTANLNRTLTFPSIMPETVPQAWASHAQRNVVYSDRAIPQKMGNPVVHLSTRYVTPVGWNSFGWSLPTAFEHFSIIRPTQLIAARYGSPRVYNNTPELYPRLGDTQEPGTAVVYLHTRYVQQRADFPMTQFGLLAATYSRRPIYPAGLPSQAFGVFSPVEDQLSRPIVRIVRMQEFPYSARDMVGSATVSTNKVQVNGFSAVQFGAFKTREQAIVFDGSKSEYEGGAFDLDMLRVPAPRAIAVYVQYAYVQPDAGTSPVQMYMKMHRVMPDYVFPALPNPDVALLFWDTPSNTADCLAFGNADIGNRLRTRTMTGTDLARLGVPAVTVPAQPKIMARGINSLYFGWLEVFGGRRWVRDFDTYQPVDGCAIPMFSVTRPPPAFDPNIRVNGLNSLEVGDNNIDTFHRSRVIGGTDMQQLPKFVVTPPFFVTPIDTDLAKYGTLYADHRIRSIIHIGEDMFEAEPDYSGADETTVSTPALPAPAQYVYAKGRKPPECCWGFYIGRAQ